MSSLKAIARDWLPPAVLRWVRHRRDAVICFDGEYNTWEEACAHSTGYDAENILAKVLATTLEVKRGRAVFERDSVLFDKLEYAWPVAAGLLGAAARNRGVLNVLDFGGSLGSSYFQNRGLLKTLASLRWNIVEQPHYVKAGQIHVQDEQLHFYSSIHECLRENLVNVIFLSSVLQYLPDPAEIFLSLDAAGADTLIIDRTIVNHSMYDRIYVQRVPPSIYNASYPCRSLSEPRLLAAIPDRYQLAADFPSLPFPALEAIRSEFKGYLFARICG